MSEEQDELERARINAEIGGLCYNGNTVSYIYDKMKCYGDQVMMAFNALRLLGWVDESNGNKERAVALKNWSEKLLAEIADLRKQNEAMEHALKSIVAEQCRCDYSCEHDIAKQALSDSAGEKGE